ncbi:MAG: DNA-3-methyladenine glycosylase I [Chloroflexi bacterium]|nr:DNA-3-methyladenine glycosylase I [Chloroflexota bacterium]
MNRCAWVNTSALMIAYHDTEWGVPVHDDHQLFEALVLGGAQAGLSWETVLRKRDAYREAFFGFDPVRVAALDDTDMVRLLVNPGIIRNRQKVTSAIKNARQVLRVREEFRSFDAYLWRFVDGAPRRNEFRALSELPARTPESDLLSRDLQQRGFTFVGPTICYAVMQAVGMVNDHTVDCFRYAEVNLRQ